MDPKFLGASEVVVVSTRAPAKMALKLAAPAYAAVTNALSFTAMEKAVELTTAQVSAPEAIALALKEIGVKAVFGIIGIPITPIADAIYDVGIDFVGMRNEQGAAYAAAAYGYFDAAKLPAFCLTVGGPGFVHALGGTSHAQMNRWPMILLSASTHGVSNADDEEEDTFQELDQNTVASKNDWGFKATFGCSNAIDFPSVLEKAVEAAMNGIPGCVYLDISRAVLDQRVLLRDLRLPKRTFRQRPEADDTQVAKAIELLASAKKPLVLVGKGVHTADACDQLKDFVEALPFQVPVLMTPMGQGALDDGHPNAVRNVHGLALRGCDVVLVLGARQNWLLDFCEAPGWASCATLIVADISKVETACAKNGVGLLGDLKTILIQLAGAAETLNVPSTSKSSQAGWMECLKKSAAEWKSRESSRLQVDLQRPREMRMTYLAVMGILRRKLDASLRRGSFRGITVASEGANTFVTAALHLPSFGPKSRLDIGTWGTMGVGLPNAIAAAFWHRHNDRVTAGDSQHLVVAIQGDSAFGFTGMELETIARWRLPVLLLILNNGGVYVGVSSSDAFRPFPSELSMTTRYELMADAFGGCGLHAGCSEELECALDQMLTAPMTKFPAVIHVDIDPAVSTGFVEKVRRQVE